MNRVFSHWKNGVLFVILSVMVYALALWLPNTKLIYFILTHSSSQIKASAILLPFLGHSLFDVEARVAIFSLSLAVLVSLNIVLLLFFVRVNRAQSSSASTLSFVGTIAGIFGLGCAACGSIFITSSIATIGGLGIVASLPFRGAEIGYVGLALLALSAFNLTREIQKPLTCAI